MALLYRDRSLFCHLPSSRGFTLLEMVLVVFIMGVLASVSLTFVETQDQQWRYEESVAKAEAVRRAVLDMQRLGNSPLVSGFIVDNGKWPPVELITDPAKKLEPLLPENLVSNTDNWRKSGVDEWAAWQLRSPYYQVVTGGEHQLTAPEYKLAKGLRSSYLAAHIDSQGAVRDGWGSDFNVSFVSPELKVSFVNASGDNKDDQYQPFTKVLVGGDWSIPLSSLSFELENASLDPLSNYHVALVIFQNGKAGEATAENAGRWTTLHFDVVGPVPAGSSIALGAPTWAESGSATVSTINLPVGEHLLVVGPLKTGSTTELDIKYAHKLKLYPKAVPPMIQIRIQ